MGKRVFQVLGLFLFSGLGSPSLGQEKARPVVVAIFEIETRRVRLDRELLEGLSNLLRSSLAQSGNFQVIPQANLRALLNQQKSESHKACFDQVCQIELGRELAAQKILSTTITRFGDRCAVSSVLFDLMRGASERSANQSGGCGEPALFELLRQIARDLVGPEPARPPAGTPANPAAIFTDTFTGQVLDDTHWTAALYKDQASVVQANGRLQTFLRGCAWDDGPWHYAALSSDGHWLLEGDFDVRVDFEVLSFPQVEEPQGDLSIQLSVFLPGYKDGAEVSRRSAQGRGGVVNAAGSIEGKWDGKERPCDIQAGTLRLVRAGEVITGYIQGTAGFEVIGARQLPWGAKPVIVQFGVYRNKTSREIGATFDNFAIVEGRLTRNPAPRPPR